MRLILLLLSLTLISTSFAKIYTWKDNNGKTIYGDNPPQSEKAEEVIIKELTIIEAYKHPSLIEDKASNNKTKSDKDKAEGNRDQTTSYESFKITYPIDDQDIRASTGDITAAFSLTPSLHEADTVFVYLDGKKMVENSKSLSASFVNLDRGSHSMFAVIRNNNGDVLINSNTVSFHVFRSSMIKKPRK